MNTDQGEVIVHINRIWIELAIINTIIALGFARQSMKNNYSILPAAPNAFGACMFLFLAFFY